MRKLFIGLAVGALAFTAMAGAATAEQPPATTFIAVLTADEEVPHCDAATNASRGVAVFHVTDEATGTVEWRLVANNLPGTDIAAHIHRAPSGVAGGIVQPLPFTATSENGVIGTGTFTNPGLVAMIRADPKDFYVNVHTTTCKSGVIRGQLDEHGPTND